jgi:Domain of unknown function (DUF4864)
MFSIRSHRSPISVRIAWRSVALAALACWGVAATAAPPRPAEVLPPAERRVIETAIRQQLDAFGRDDAVAAFAVATPDIQRTFGTAAHFLDVVRDDYEPVYRPAGVRFQKLERVDGEWTQSVLITDAQGKVWRALYTMRRQTDRSWKIGGCQLVATDALAT